MQTDNAQIPHPIRDALNDAIARTIAVLALGVIALIHTLESPDAFDDAGYLGVLFVAAALASLAVGVALTRTSDVRAWVAAGALPCLILLGYVISRTAGLPSATDDVGDWTEPLALAAMVVEGLLVGLSAATLATHPQASRVAVAIRVDSPARRAPAA